MLEVGTQAPDFTLPDQIKQFTWSDYAFDEARSTDASFVFAR